MASTIFLICAVLASLSAGVLLAYTLCLAMFKAFRIHTAATTRRTVHASQPALES